MAKTIVALFDTGGDAQAAIEELMDLGYQRNDISVIAQKPEFPPTPPAGPNGAAEGAGVGATAGTVAGGLAGLLASLGLLAIPGVGPILAAGPIVAVLTGAGLGAAAGGVIGALIGMGIPEEDAEFYSEGVRRGGTLVSVQADEPLADRVAEILSAHNAVDVERRAAAWQAAGWKRRIATPPSALPPVIDPKTRGAETPHSESERPIRQPEPTRTESSSIYQDPRYSASTRTDKP